MTTVDETASARAGAREWAGLAVLALPVLVLALDLNVLHLAAPALSADLGAGSTQLLWILDVYGFMVAGLLVTMGTLGDRIGRRRLLLIGAAAFAAASVVAAYAPTAEALIAARALLGVAGATLMPSTLGLIGNLFPDPKQRSLAIGVWVTAFIGGSAIGPVVGGLMLERFWWGSVLLLGVPVMALLLVTGPMLLPEHRTGNGGRIDLVSSALALAAMLPVIYGVKEFAKDGWDPLAAASLAVGAAFGALFVRRQRRLADPLVDMRLFRSQGFGAALVALLLGTIALGGMTMLFVQYLQMVEGRSAMETGLWMIPAVAASIAVSATAPVLARRWRPAAVIGVGLPVAILGLLLFSRLESGDGVALPVAGTILMFIGATPLMVLSTDLVVGSAPKERASSAASLSETTSELGSALSIAVVGSIITAVYGGRMSSAPLTGAVPEAARDNLAAALEAAEGLPGRDAAGLVAAGRAAFTDAVHMGALMSAGVLAATLAVVVVALRRVPPIGGGGH